jgi:hypothetical protein
MNNSKIGTTAAVPESSGPYPHLYMYNTGSEEINGQLVAQAKSWYYTDMPAGPYKRLPSSPPQAAPGYGGSSAYTNYANGIVTGGSGDGQDARAQTVANAASNPWHPVHSPVPWLIGMFLVGWLLLRHVSWGYEL